jgi:N-acyl-D-aspartate/D-glutamate deacylase
MFDILIKGGTLVDGTGAPSTTADVAVRDGTIVDVGRVSGEAHQIIDADGLMVTPGFVDIHTHFDGQITWDSLLTPSCWHGVTTIVQGNCGVGFAPAMPDRHEWLVALMEGVEDIPGTALHEGINWRWETFPEYLDYLGELRRVMDFGAQVPYAAVRAYVMGDRCLDSAATPDELEAMANIVHMGVDAGALGLSMNRTLAHRAIDGSIVPGTNAEHDEIMAVCAPLGVLGRGVLELAPAGVTGDDLNAPAREVDWMGQVAAATGRPVTYVLVQHNADPDAWRVMLDRAGKARRAGVQLYPQIHARSPMLLMGLGAKLNPLLHCPSFASLATLPVSEQAARIRTDDELRAQLVAELTATTDAWVRVPFTFDNMFPLGLDRPRYEPTADESVASRAAREARHPCAVVIDELVQGDGKGLLNIPILNFSRFTHDPIFEMMTDPTTVVGLADGGAHCNTICDAGVPTHMLEHWARDRIGQRLPIETAVRKISRDTAEVYGLLDRGVVAPGMRADLNVIDFDAVAQKMPRLVHDLPTGAPRFIQESTGYVATIAGGEVTFRNGEHTGALPGHLLRGARRDPRTA